MPERSSDNVHKIFFYIKEENKLTDSHVSLSDLYIFVIVQWTLSRFFFSLLTGISYGKSVETAEKSALKFVNLSSLKVIRLKRAKI